jgi:hypothetical protein
VSGRWTPTILQFLNELPPEIVKIHIAVYEGYPVGAENIIYKTEINPGDAMSIQVSSGENRFFLIGAENTSGMIQYSGISGPYHVSSDNVVNVVVSMSEVQTSFRRLGAFALTAVTWSAINGASYYVLYMGDFDSAYPDTNPYDDDIVYSGISSYFATSLSRYYRVRAYFEAFGLFSHFTDAIHTDSMPTL